MDIYWGDDSGLNIFEVDEFGVEYENRSEVEISSNWVEKARFLKVRKMLQWAFLPFRNWAEGNRSWTEDVPSWTLWFTLACNDGLARRAVIFGRWSIHDRFRFYACSRIIRTISSSCVRTHHVRSDRSRKIWFLFWWTLFSITFLFLVEFVLVGKNLYALGSRERGYKAWFNYIIFLNKLFKEPMKIINSEITLKVEKFQI